MCLPTSVVRGVTYKGTEGERRETVLASGSFGPFLRDRNFSVLSRGPSFPGTEVNLDVGRDAPSPLFRPGLSHLP